MFDSMFAVSVALNVVLVVFFVRHRLMMRTDYHFIKEHERKRECMFHAAALIFYEGYSREKYTGFDCMHPFAQLADTLHELRVPRGNERPLYVHAHDALTDKVEKELEKCIEILRRQYCQESASAAE